MTAPTLITVSDSGIEPEPAHVGPREHPDVARAPSGGTRDVARTARARRCCGAAGRTRGARASWRGSRPVRTRRRRRLARTVCSAPSGSAKRSVTPLGVERRVEHAVTLADVHAGLLRVAAGGGRRSAARGTWYVWGVGVSGGLREVGVLLRRSRRASRSSRPTCGRSRPPRSSSVDARAPGRSRCSRAAGTRRCGSEGTAPARRRSTRRPRRASAVGRAGAARPAADDGRVEVPGARRGHAP